MKVPRCRMNQCVNCGTRRYPIKARGYCSRCYPIVLRQEQVNRWDPSHPGTLHHYPKSLSSQHWQSEFQRIKAHTIKELRKRLLHFRLIEDQLAGPTGGYDIEIRLRTLARRAGARNRHVLSGIAGALDSKFTPEQRKLLFKWLNEIFENVKWNGINSLGYGPSIEVTGTPKTGFTERSRGSSHTLTHPHRIEQ